jgi:broad specificity phosphatase PhoE
MKIALIPCGKTEWHAEGRLLGRVELPLNEPGQSECSTWAEQLEPLPIDRILHGPDELTKQTAGCLARRLSVPTKSVDDLVEIDLGLWTGLTESQLKSRYPSAHRELCDAPLNVHPPGGEDLSNAADRLVSCIRRHVKKNGDKVVGVVMRPLSFAMARAQLEGREPKEIWKTALDSAQPLLIEVAAPAKASVAK